MVLIALWSEVDWPRMGGVGFVGYKLGARDGLVKDVGLLG